MNKLCYEDLFPTRSVASGRDTVMRRRRSGEKYRSPYEDDFSSEDGGPLAAFRMTIFPDGNREDFIQSSYICKTSSTYFNYA